MEFFKLSKGFNEKHQNDKGKKAELNKDNKALKKIVINKS